jgi:hypothetical protein
LVGTILKIHKSAAKSRQASQAKQSKSSTVVTRQMDLNDHFVSASNAQSATASSFMGYGFYKSGGNDAGNRDNQAPIRKTKRTSRISLYDLQQETFELGLNISRGTDDIRDTSSTYDTAMVGLAVVLR